MSAVMRPNSPHMRPMREADLDQVVAIEQQVYPFPWTRVIFSDCLRVGYSCWVAELDGEVAAYGVLSVGPGEAHVLNLCVKPLRQFGGLGTKMLARLVDLARWQHCASVFLEVRPSNERAVRLYRRNGFVIVGRRPNYYPAEFGREDALIMALKLGLGEDLE